MALTELVRPPLTLALRVGELALEGAAGMLRVLRTAVEHSEADERWAATYTPEREEEAPPGREVPERDAGPEPPRRPDPRPVGRPDAAWADDAAEPPSAVEARVDDSPIPERPTVPPQVKTDLDDEDEVVAEFADAGAEGGAGAQLEVEEPWEGFGEMKATEVVRALDGASVEVLAAVRLYEGFGKKRRSVLQAVDKRLGQEPGS